MSSAPLTRNIGATERTLQALLQKMLAVEAVTFPEWTAFVLLSAADGSLSSEALIKRIVAGRIAGATDAAQLLSRLIEQGQLIQTANGELEASPDAQVVYLRLRAQVDRTTAQLFDGLQPEDIDATRRTLDLIVERAARLIAA